MAIMAERVVRLWRPCLLCLVRSATCSTAPWCMPSGTMSSTRQPRWLPLIVFPFFYLLFSVYLVFCVFVMEQVERGIAIMDFEGVDWASCPLATRRTCWHSWVGPLSCE